MAPLQQERNESKRAELRGELLRLMAQAIYLGFTESEISALYHQVLEQREGEKHD
ncbi:hypothetical protein D3C81_2122330 [compost metagenome]